MTVERSLVLLTGKLRVLIQQRLWLQVLIGMFAGIGVGITRRDRRSRPEGYCARAASGSEIGRCDNALQAASNKPGLEQAYVVKAILPAPTEGRL